MKIETNHINVLDLSNYEIDVIKKILKNTEVYKKINLRNVEELDNDSITDILKENKTIDKLFGSLLNKINENSIINIKPNEFIVLKKGIAFEYTKKSYCIDISTNQSVIKDLSSLLFTLEKIHKDFNLGLNNF
jgi:hypothetical protein